MNYKSPLFISAMELLAHSTELYAQKNHKKYKFIILHLANSVELILKDKLIASNCSIYIENSNKTIGVWDCFKALDKLGISTPERPIIELLIDDRNTIQHRFGFPNEESVYYYLDQIVNFFKRFLADEYKTDLVDELRPHLKKEYLELLGLVENENHHLNKLKEVSIEMAILNAYGQIDNEFYSIVESVEDRESVRNRHPLIGRLDLLINYLIKYEKLDKEIADKFGRLRILRNNIAHARLKDENISRKELEEYFRLCKEILNTVNSLKQQGFFTQERIKEMLGLNKKSAETTENRNINDSETR